MDASGSSSDSSTASALTLPAAPTLTATGGDTVVSLSWNWVQSENGYTITRSATPNGTPTATFNPTGTTLIDDGLADGNTYYYKIYASNATGNGPSYSASAAVSGTIPNSGGGLTGEYARDNNERVTENDTTVDSTQITMPPTGISPSTPSPGEPTPPDVWSCRWSGYIQAPVSGSYNFLMPGSEYEQVTVGSTEVAYVSSIPYTSAIPPVYNPVTLTAGQLYPVVIQFMAAYPESTVQLQWQLPGNQNYETVAANYLSPAIAALSAPTGLEATETGGVMSIGWSDSQSSGCDIYRSQLTGAEDYGAPVDSAPVQPLQSGGTAYSYSDDSVALGESYYYAARTVYRNPVTQDQTLSTPSSETSYLVPERIVAVSCQDDLLLGATATTTCSVLLSEPAPTATSVSIRASSSGLTVPASVSVAAGQTSASFEVTAQNDGDDYSGQIVASYGGWVQRCPLFSLANINDCSVQDVTATSGDGSVLVSWDASANACLGNYAVGYNVYRIAGGDRTLLTEAPVKTQDYLDGTPSIGQDATYEVDLVASDTTVLSSATDTVTASSGSGSLSWVSVPTSTWTGTVNFTAQNPTPGQAWIGELFVDGYSAGSVGSGGGDQDAGSLYASLDTSTLANGQHVIVVAGDNVPLQVTPPMSITISNGPVLSGQAVFELDAGETAGFHESLSSGDVWTANLTNTSGNILRAWSAPGPLDLAWDGLDGSGNEVPDGDYTLNVSSQGPSGHLAMAWTTSKLHSAPQFLALCMGNTKLGDGGDPAPNDVLYCAHLKSYLAARQRAVPGFSFFVAFEPYGRVADYQLLDDVRKWLGAVNPKVPGSGSVQFFYLYDHGCLPDSTGNQNGQFGETFIYDYNYYYNTKKGSLLGDKRAPRSIFSIPFIVGTRQYKFAWIDICYSGGATADGPDGDMTASPNTLWASDFNINLWGGDGAVMLWNGAMLLNQWDGGPYQWQRYREAFWNSISAGNTVLNSISFAITNCGAFDEEISPVDYQWFGSAEQFKLYNWGDVPSIP